MYQIENSTNGIEESPTYFQAGFSGQENQAQEGLAIQSVEPKGSSPLEGSGFFDEMSNNELIALLIAGIFLIAVAFWFFENIDERLERIGRKLQRWQKRNRSDHRVEFPIASGELELPPTSTTNQSNLSASSLVETTPFLESERRQQQSNSLEPQLVSESGEKSTEAESKIRKFENETRQLKEQLADQSDASNSKNSRIDSLQQELDDKIDELEKLQAALEDANLRANKNTESLSDQSGLRHQELADELAEAKEMESQARSELADAKEQLESLTSKTARVEQEMETAYQELLSKGDVALGLRSELTSFESLAQSLQEKLTSAESDLEEQLNQNQVAQSKIEKAEADAVELREQLDAQTQENASKQASESSQIEALEKDLADQATQIQELQESINEASSTADQKAASLEDSDLRCQKLTDELAELKLARDKSDSDLASAKEEIEALTSKATQVESDLQITNQEVLEKSDLAESLLEKNTCLNSDLEKLENLFTEAEAKAKELSESQDKLQAQLQAEIDNREQAAKELDAAKQEIADLTRLADESKSKLAHRDNDLQEEIEKLQVSLDETRSNELKFENTCDELNSKIVDRESQLSAAQEEVASLKSEIASLSQDTRLELAEAVKMLTHEQTLHDELKIAANQDRENLSLQVAKFSEQESRMESLQQQAKKSDHELAQTLKLLENEKAQNAELKNASQQFEVELGQKNSQYAELETRFQDLTQSSAQNLSAESKKLERQGLKIDELRVALKKERGRRAETLKQLENEQAQNVELKNASQQFEVQLGEKNSQYAELETRFQDLTQSNAKNQSAGSKQLEQQGLKIDKLQVALEKERAANAELENASQRFEVELNQKNSQYAELETKFQDLTQSNAQNQSAGSKQLEQQGLKIDKLQVALEKERAANAELENASQRFEVELNQKNSQYAELETKFQGLAQSNAQNQSADSKQLEQQGLKIDELQIALEKEKELRSEVHQKLETSQTRLQELEKDAQTSTVDQANYDELVHKVDKYKKAFRKSKTHIEGLTAQKAEMSELATEYLAAAKILRRDLDQQLQTSRELKSKLDKAKSSGSSEAEINRLVEQRARKYVLELKSQFEIRLKQKNELIRKLQKRQTVES